MSKIQLELEVPDEVKQIEDEFRAAAQESLLQATALRLFEKGLISSGYGAAMLGITRWDFIQLLGKHGIPFFNYGAEEEIEQELQAVAEERTRLDQEREPTP